MAVGIGDAAVAVARCMAGGMPICAAASAVAAAYAAYRVYADEDGDLMSDPGTDQTTGTAYQYRCTVQSNGAGYGGWYNTKEQACSARASVLSTSTASYCPSTNGSVNITTVGEFLGFGTGSTALFKKTQTDPCPGRTTTSVGNYTGGWSGQNNNNVTQCPASIDFSNPAYSIPAGSPVGQDGKCPTARYNHIPTTAEAAGGKVAANPPTDPAPWVQPTKDAIQSGGQQAPAGIETTGPASQTGSGTTTTTTGGSPAQTTVETKTPTYTYNYAGDTITYNTSYTTINNNITTGTTTTTTETPAPATPQDPEDPCTAEPDRLGCIKLGKPPDDQVPTKSSEISYSAESVGLPSGCPSPKTIAGKSFSYEPICETATNARPWVIVGAVFSALMLMLAGVRQV